MGWKRSSGLGWLFGLLLLGSLNTYAQELNEEAWRKKAETLDYELSDYDIDADTDLGLDAPSSSFFNWDLSTLLLPLGIALLALILFVLLSMYLKKGGGKGAKKTHTLDELEDISDEVLDDMLQKREHDEDFRASIRLRYLKILKWLSTNGHINWKKDKTNSQYQLEMLGHPDSSNFNQATLYFEQVWYGEIEVNAAIYNQLSPIYDDLLKKWRADEQ